MAAIAPETQQDRQAEQLSQDAREMIKAMDSLQAMEEADKRDAIDVGHDILNGMRMDIAGPGNGGPDVNARERDADSELIPSVGSAIFGKDDLSPEDKELALGRATYYMTKLAAQTLEEEAGTAESPEVADAKRAEAADLRAQLEIMPQDWRMDQAPEGQTEVYNMAVSKTSEGIANALEVINQRQYMQSISAQQAPDTPNKAAVQNVDGPDVEMSASVRKTGLFAAIGAAFSGFKDTFAQAFGRQRTMEANQSVGRMAHEEGRQEEEERLTEQELAKIKETVLADGKITSNEMRLLAAMGVSVDDKQNFMASDKKRVDVMRDLQDEIMKDGMIDAEEQAIAESLHLKVNLRGIRMEYGQDLDQNSIKAPGAALTAAAREAGVMPQKQGWGRGQEDE